MTDNPTEAPGPTNATVFVTAEQYVIGTGETIDELQATGEWLATEAPVEVRR